MDIYAAQWIGTTWQESTDKMKLTSRPSTSPPLMEVRGTWQREGGTHFLVDLESYLPVVVPWTGTLQPDHRRATRLSQKLQNHKEQEGFNWNNWRLGSGERAGIEQLSSNEPWGSLPIFSQDYSVIHWQTETRTQISSVLAPTTQIPLDDRPTVPLVWLFGHLYLSGNTLTRSCQKDKRTRKRALGASLVAQWWRICLLMQETWVQSLIQEDPACLRQLSPCSTAQRTFAAMKTGRAQPKINT